jgi:EAL domain-containing protein (putative c-di-GMP-specific phosphodiesterase class I)
MQPILKDGTEDPVAKGRILIVDDEPTLRRVYARMLRASGYTVEEAANGKQAVRLIRDTAFNVIVSDIGMPGIDGVELLRQVRERDLDVPVLLITGQPAVETAIRAVEYGAIRYLLKPIDEKTFVENVELAARLHQMAKLKRQALSLLGDAVHQPGDRCGLDASLTRALTSLWMAYQPIISWTGRTLYAFEALLRTTEERFPHPGALLEAAERLGRVHDVGRATRAHVAARVLESPAECVFVNLHTHDLLDPDLYEADSPLSKVAEKVVLEITERATLDDVKDVPQRVANLRTLGFRIAIDDLGAGYAGLTSFAQLEPDVVKLDMSLVRDVHQHPTKRKLVSSMAALCRDMGIKVVAEGIETAEERDVLVECSCDLLQGYLFARPAEPFPAVDWGVP